MGLLLQIKNKWDLWF